MRNLLNPKMFERIVAFRRDLHEHPELSFEEHRSGEQVALALEGLGLAVTRKVAGTGVVAEIAGGEGPRVALRADLDALPLVEETGLPYSSKTPGVMHACGHDGHTAMLLGAAELLTQLPPSGQVRLLFQPAEERGNGAAVVCKEGHLEGVEAVFGIHIDPRWPCGTILVQPGPMNASTRSFRIVLRGKGGHAARPHLGVDALLTGARLVEALQSVVSRELPPGQPAVVTVGRFAAGTSRNVLAGEAELEGTIRCFDAEVEEAARQAIERITHGVATTHRAEAELQFGEGCPAVLNDTAMAQIASEAAAEIVGPQRVLPLPEPNMGGEDFSFYLDHVPGCYVRLGAGLKDQEPVPAHSPQFVWNEEAMAVGARYFEAVARRALDHLSTKS